MRFLFLSACVGCGIGMKCDGWREVYDEIYYLCRQNIQARRQVKKKGKQAYCFLKLQIWRK